MFSILSPFELHLKGFGNLETAKARMKLPFCGERPGHPAVSVVVVTRGFVAG